MNKLTYSYLIAKKIIDNNEKNYITIICENQFDEKDIIKINEYPDRIFVKCKKNDISFDFKELKSEDAILYHILICDIDIENLESYFVKTLKKKNEYKLNDKLFKNVLDHFIIIQPNIGYVINELNNECSNSNNINLLKIKYLFSSYIYDKILKNRNYLFFNIYNIFNFPYLELKSFIPQQHKENINDISENNFTMSNISEILDDRISYFTLEYKYNENKINNIYEYNKYKTPRIGKYKLSTYFDLFKFIMENNKFNDKKEFEIKNVDYECLLSNISSNSEFDNVYFDFIHDFYRFDYDLVNTNIYLDTKIILYMIKNSNVKLLYQKSEDYITKYEFVIMDEN